MIGRTLFPMLILCARVWGQQYSIATVAGNGTAGYAGDGGAPGDAQLNSPASVALDSSGNVYFADQSNHRIRMISKGVIGTVAGAGTAGYSGDKAQATSANLNSPAGVAVDSSGNLYIADSGNHVIRKVSGGTITTIAGSGASGYSGDGGLATVADLASPTGVAVDSAGNIYTADSNNSLIRRITPAGIINSYVGAGATSGRLNHPTGIAIDPSGALYIADSNNRRVVKYSAATLSVFAGNGANGFSGDGGQATSAVLNNPNGVAVDAAGNVYIADTSNSRIRKVTPDGIISTIAGKGTFAYSGDGGPASSAALYFPRGVAVDAAGNVYVADTSNHALRLLTPAYPAINSGGVVNAASFTAQISAGALASVFGTGFGSTTASPGTPLPASVNGVSVTVNGKAAPILALTPAQINFQTPWSTAAGTAKIAVSVNGGASNIASVPVLTAAPGLFVQANGAAIVQNFPDYSLNDDAHPIPAGGTIIAYLTGSGPVSPSVADGAVTPAVLVQATSPVSAQIGTTPAAVAFVGLTPGFVGLAQANIVVPASLTTGRYPLTVTINGETSNTGAITVK